MKLEETVKNLDELLSKQNFDVPFGLEEGKKSSIIKKRGDAFAEDVLETIGKEKGDDYFIDLYKSLLTNIAIVCMLYKNSTGENATIRDILECITDFSKLQPMMEAVEKKYPIDNSEKGNPYEKTLSFIKNEIKPEKNSIRLYDQTRELRVLFQSFMKKIA